MGTDIELEKVTEIADGSRVCHYDELHREAKTRFPELVESGAPCVDEEVAHGFGACDVVKFTDYYQVSFRT